MDRRVPREFNEVPQDSPFWHRCQTLPIIIRVNLLWRAPIHSHARFRCMCGSFREAKVGEYGWRSGGFGPGGRVAGGGDTEELSRAKSLRGYDPTWYNFPNKPVLTWRATASRLCIACNCASRCTFLPRSLAATRVHDTCTRTCPCPCPDRVPSRMFETRERAETCSCKVDKLISSRWYCYFAQPVSFVHRAF